MNYLISKGFVVKKRFWKIIFNKMVKDFKFSFFNLKFVCVEFYYVEMEKICKEFDFIIVGLDI